MQEPVTWRHTRNFGQHSRALGVVRRTVHTSVSSEISREVHFVVKIEKQLHGLLKVVKMLSELFQPLMILNKQFLIIREVQFPSLHCGALNIPGSTVMSI